MLTTIIFRHHIMTKVFCVVHDHLPASNPEEITKYGCISQRPQGDFTTNPSGPDVVASNMFDVAFFGLSKG